MKETSYLIQIRPRCLMRGYHYLMRYGHALNVLARYSYALAKHIRHHGVRGAIAFVQDTLAGGWFSAQELARIATEPCQIRLEWGLGGELAHPLLNPISTIRKHQRTV